jgi:hypothetical protein
MADPTPPTTAAALRDRIRVAVQTHATIATAARQAAQELKAPQTQPAPVPSQAGQQSPSR